MIDVRRAIATDAAVLARLIAAAFGEYRDRLVPPSGALNETHASIASELAEPDRLGFVALDDGEPAGCVLCKPENGELYFGRLSVPPPMRGRGVARRLIETVEAHARAHRYPAVALAVRVALPENERLFGRFGYVEVSRYAHDGFDHPTSIRMRKAIRLQ